MCKVEAVLIIAASLLAANGFCKYQLNSEKEVGHHSEIKSESPCEKDYNNYCLNGSECYSLVDEDIVAFSCTWLYGGQQ